MNKFRNVALSIITAVGISNTIGYTFLENNDTNDNTVSNNETAETNDTSNSQETPAYSDTPEVDLTSEKSEDSNNKITEKAELKSEKKPDELKELKATEPSSTDVVVSTENKVEESVPTDKKTNSNDGKEYSIKNIKSNIVYNKDDDYDDYGEFFWSLDPANDSVFVIEYDKQSSVSTINMISLSTGNSKEVISDEYLEELLYNPFTGETFAILGDYLCNLVTGNVYTDISDFMLLRFIDSNLLVGASGSTGIGSTWYLRGEELRLTDDDVSVSKSGYICIGRSDGIRYIQPIIYNDCYYWVTKDIYDNGLYNLNYTLQSVKEKHEDITKPIEVFNAVACTVSNNEVYFMMSDFSVYKLNMELVTEKQNAPVTTVPEKNIYSDKTENTETDPVKKYCSLYLDGSKIKQTGKTNLNSVNSFYIRNNGDVVVFDTFDSTIKVIEKNQG